MTPEETLLEAVKHSPLYMTVDREVLHTHLQFVAAERVKLNERIAYLVRSIRDAVEELKEGNQSASDAPDACALTLQMLRGVLRS